MWTGDLGHSLSSQKSCMLLTQIGKLSAWGRKSICPSKLCPLIRCKGVYEEASGCLETTKHGGKTCSVLVGLLKRYFVIRNIGPVLVVICDNGGEFPILRSLNLWYAILSQETMVNFRYWNEKICDILYSLNTFCDTRYLTPPSGAILVDAVHLHIGGHSL